MTTRLGGCLVALAMGFVFAACGSSGSTPSASQKVCSDRSQLSSAVSTVGDDLRSGSLSKARDDLPAVRDAANSLRQSAQGLKSQESQALSAEIDGLKTSVANLKNSESLSELQSGVSTVKAEAQSISTELADTLKCS